jgi:hypothetical protein
MSTSTEYLDKKVAKGRSEDNLNQVSSTPDW